MRSDEIEKRWGIIRGGVWIISFYLDRVEQISYHRSLFGGSGGLGVPIFGPW